MSSVYFYLCFSGRKTRLEPTAACQNRTFRHGAKLSYIINSANVDSVKQTNSLIAGQCSLAGLDNCQSVLSIDLAQTCK